MYNRCKLTRMVLDTEWEDKVWEESWQYSSKWEGEQTESDQDFQESSRLKRKKGSTGPRKRAKLDTAKAEHRTTWGETISAGEQETITFLLSSRETPQEIPKVKSSQRRMKVFTGVEWMARELLLKVADGAADLGMEIEKMKEWPEWKEDKPAPVFRKRSKKEEEQLQKMLLKFDKEQFQAEQRDKKKAAKEQEKAGKIKNQPTLHQFLLSSTKNISNATPVQSDKQKQKPNQKMNIKPGTVFCAAAKLNNFGVENNRKHIADTDAQVINAKPSSAHTDGEPSHNVVENIHGGNSALGGRRSSGVKKKISKSSEHSDNSIKQENNKFKNIHNMFGGAIETKIIQIIEISTPRKRTFGNNHTLLNISDFSNSLTTTQWGEGVQSPAKRRKLI